MATLSDFTTEQVVLALLERARAGETWQASKFWAASLSAALEAERCEKFPCGDEKSRPTKSTKKRSEGELRRRERRRQKRAADRAACTNTARDDAPAAAEQPAGGDKHLGEDQADAAAMVLCPTPSTVEAAQAAVPAIAAQAATPDASRKRPYPPSRSPSASPVGAGGAAGDAVAGQDAAAGGSVAWRSTTTTKLTFHPQYTSRGGPGVAPLAGVPND